MIGRRQGTSKWYNVRMNWLRAIRTTIVVGLTISTIAHNADAEDCIPPRILFVVDGSSSMLGELEGMTKWAAAQSAIETVLTAYTNAAEYGLMVFPGAPGMCTTGEVKVDIAAGTRSTILSTIQSLDIPGNAQTPAGQSLMAAAEYGLITDPTHPNYVVFITDGWQYCSINGGSSCATQQDCDLMGVSPCPSCNAGAEGCYCVQDWTVLGAEALAAKNVKTYVVGFGTQVNAKALNQTAQAGQTALSGCDPMSDMASCYYQATNPSELTAAFSKIVAQVVTEKCSADCGIEGERTCGLGGWSECVGPGYTGCVSTCDTPGTKQCINGTLTDCSSEGDCPPDGTGGAGGQAATASASTSSTGGSGGQVGTGGQAPDNIEEEGGCGCVLPGHQPPQRSSYAWLIGLGLLLWRRRREATVQP